MKTIRFNKTECGVDFLINVIDGANLALEYYQTSEHNSDFFEILFFRKRCGQLYLDDKPVQIEDNTIVFISPFQRKKWKFNPTLMRFTALVFQEDFLNDFFADKLFTFRLLYFYQLEHPFLMKVTDQEIGKSCGILQEIKSELVRPKPDSQHIIRSLLYYLLQTLNRQYAHKNNLSLDEAKNSHAYQFKKLLEEHIVEKQRISDYAKMLGISRISLNKAVKAQFNATATQLLKQRLLFAIKNTLAYSNRTITEIAYEYNFSEPNHLMRFFKTQTGQTISEFLETIKVNS